MDTHGAKFHGLVLCLVDREMNVRRVLNLYDIVITVNRYQLVHASRAGSHLRRFLGHISW